MLHTKTVAQDTLELLIRLMNDSAFDNFRLVGGTSLSLQIGHRMSVDLDLFTNLTFDEQKMLDYLRTEYSFELDYMDKETLKGEINGVKIDCIAHKYPWLNSPVLENSIRLAGYEDISAMKLNAIVGNGTRIKDYIDTAYLVEKLSFNEMLKAYQNKYKSNPVMVLKAIVYFEDIDFAEPIRMMDKPVFEWKIIKKRLEMMLKSPDKIFKSNSTLTD